MKRRDLLRTGALAGAVSTAALLRLADVLMSDSLAGAGLVPGSARTMTLAALRRRVDHLWHRYQSGFYQIVWTELPDVLRSVRAIERQDEAAPTATNDVASRSFQLAASLAYKAGDPTLGLLAAERGLAAASAAGDRLLSGVAITRVAHGLRGLRRGEEAADLSLRAAAALESPQRGEPHGRRSVYGALLLHAAMAAAHRRDVQTARGLLIDARAVAARTGDTNHYWTAFGPANVTAWNVSIHLRLGDAPRALAAADKLHPGQLPVAERRGHFFLDKASAYSQCGDTGHAVTALLAAEDTAPDEVRSLPSAGKLVAELLPRTRGEDSHSLRRLAARMNHTE